LENQWEFFKPTRDLSNLIEGDILVKKLNNKNTGHMAIYISGGCDGEGKYANMIESSSSITEISNVQTLVKLVNKNIPKYKISMDDFNDASITEIRDKLLLTKNTDRLTKSIFNNKLNLHQIRAISALLCPNGGVRLSKWRWGTIQNYIGGRIIIYNN
jgi:hypothetical protein